MFTHLCVIVLSVGIVCVYCSIFSVALLARSLLKRDFNLSWLNKGYLSIRVASQLQFSGPVGNSLRVEKCSRFAIQLKTPQKKSAVRISRRGRISDVAQLLPGFYS